MQDPGTLSEKSRRVLEQVAKGRTYEQILSRDPELSYLDIFASAREALTLAGEEREDYTARLARIKQRHPRAYERWTDDEDAQLRREVQHGAPVAMIAERLQRQPSAIRSRMAKLGIDEDTG